MQLELFANPYKPGAGHMPPHLAGRQDEIAIFIKLLDQREILQNAVVTGLRGVGKTVLLESLRPKALARNWLWVGSDLSESTSVSETTLAQRIITDLSTVTSNIVVEKITGETFGLAPKPIIESSPLGYEALTQIYDQTPGLTSDKLKAVLERAWQFLSQTKFLGVVFAYDEAQTMSDHVKKEQYPLALLLDVFNSIQKKKIPFLLTLSGLPTLFPKLVDSRTYAERMFKIISLERLAEPESKEAIWEPIQNFPLKFTQESIDLIIKTSGGYPYFIQFLCKEAYDIMFQRATAGSPSVTPISIQEIVRKLDRDFFSARFEKMTDRQKELMFIICALESSDDEFTVQEIVSKSKEVNNPFSNSHVNQLLNALNQHGLVYRNRYGKYSFAVPLWGNFVRRQEEKENQS